MNSPILELLPSIHATIISMFGAFFSAFAVFAFQKLFDSKDELDKAIKETKELAKITAPIRSNTTSFKNENGFLDVDKMIRAMHNARSTYMDGITYETLPDRIEKSGDDLLDVLYTVFTTYPFGEKNNSNTPDTFDFERLKALETIIPLLSFYWGNSKKSILRLINAYTKIKIEKHVTFFDEEFKKEIEKAFLEKKSYEFIQAMRSSHQNQKNELAKNFDVNYNNIVCTYFETVEKYKHEVLPKLSKALHQHDIYYNKFDIKDWSLQSLKLISFVLFFGVLAPLIILEMATYTKNLNWDGFWISFLEISLILITSAPYFYICFTLYKKVQKLQF